MGLSDSAIGMVNDSLTVAGEGDLIEQYELAKWHSSAGMPKSMFF